METDIVDYQIGIYKARLPSDHMLQTYQNINASYNTYFSGWFKEFEKIDVILDIGANVGTTTLLYSTYTKAKICCVEPSQRYFDYLRFNIINNNLESRVELKNIALLPGKKHETVLIKESRGTGYSIITQNPDSQNLTPGIPINEFLSSSNDRYDLIKSDTDGLDVFLISDILKSDTASESILSFELDPTLYGENGLIYIGQLINDLELKQYQIIVVDNFGQPFTSLKGSFSSLLNNLVWLQNQEKSGSRSIYYFDVWAFPRSRQNEFRKIEVSLGFRCS